MPVSYPVTRLRDLHPDAGTLRFRADTKAMHTFELFDIEGRRIKNTNHEAHEQYVVRHFLKRSDTVLEFGGGLGAQSIQINDRLANKTKHYVFEPQRELVEVIRKNKRLNGSKFTVVHGVLSKEASVTVPAFSRRDWLFASTSSSSRGVRVATVRRLPFKPTAIVADCEGCLLGILESFPQILDNIRFVYVENDGGTPMYRAIQKILIERGMRQVVDTSHHKAFLI